jgi:hypothetical protein
VLVGALIAGVAAFAIAREDDGESIVAAVTPEETVASDDDETPTAPPQGSPAASPSPTPTARPSTPTPVPATASPSQTVTAAPATPVATTPAATGSTAAATAPATPAPATISPTPGGPPSFTFGGFEGSCAPISAIMHVENVNQPTSIGGTWTRTDGNTVITVEPLTIEPADPGSVFTIRFPTVAPLTPGLYTFAATVDGVVVAASSTQITC